MKQRQSKPRWELPKENLTPVFKFSTGLLLYTLTEDQREVLKVDKGNPGVVVILSE